MGITVDNGNVTFWGRRGGGGRVENKIHYGLGEKSESGRETDFK